MPRGMGEATPARADRRSRVDEPALAAFWDAYVDSPHQRVGFVLRHPWRLLLAVLAVLRLPRVAVHVPGRRRGRSGHPDVVSVVDTLDAPGFARIPARATGMAALEVPPDGASYSEGSRRQTLRRKCRAAERRGMTCRRVDDRAERERLVALTHAAEQQHPDDDYRRETPDNTDLLDHDLWLVVEDADGEPVLVAVAPLAGDVAVLRYFRTLTWGPGPSDARYLATRCLVESVAERGARWLVDPQHPGEQRNGVREFQRMVGFRYVRLHRARGAAASTPVRPAG